MLLLLMQPQQQGCLVILVKLPLPAVLPYLSLGLLVLL